MSSEVEKAPLPQLDTLDSRILAIDHLPQAYRQLLKFERAATEVGRNNNLVCIRVLGYFLLEGPTDTVRKTITDYLWKCEAHPQKEEKYLSLADHYIRFLVQPFMRTDWLETRTPTLEGETESGGEYFEFDPIWSDLDRTPFTQAHINAKRDALHRDKYHCLVTKKVYDRDSLDCVEQLPDDAVPMSIKCAHIIPTYLGVEMPGEPPERAKERRETASNFWDILRLFGYTHLQELLDPSADQSKIHHLKNVLTLSHSPQGLFDNFCLWFESTDRPNTYQIQVHPPHLKDVNYIMGMQDEVTFTSPDPERYPLPSKELLDPHAACSRVACRSGVGGYIATIQHELALARN